MQFFKCDLLNYLKCPISFHCNEFQPNFMGIWLVIIVPERGVTRYLETGNCRIETPSYEHEILTQCHLLCYIIFEQLNAWTNEVWYRIWKLQMYKKNCPLIWYWEFRPSFFDKLDFLKASYNSVQLNNKGGINLGNMKKLNTLFSGIVVKFRFCIWKKLMISGSKGLIKETS